MEAFLQRTSLELSSVWALLAAFEDPLPIPSGVSPFEGAAVKGVDSISWMGNNTQKLSDSSTVGPSYWTFLSTANFGRWNKVPQENIPNPTAARVKKSMLESVENGLGLSRNTLPAPMYSKVQLWGAALPTNTPSVPLYGTDARETFDFLRSTESKTTESSSKSSSNSDLTLMSDDSDHQQGVL